MLKTSSHMRNRRAQAGRRRGALYITVLGASLVVTLLSLAAIHGVRINLNRALSKPDRVTASLIADAGIEHALATIDADPNWRSTLNSGISYPPTPLSISGGTVTWKIVDADGVLNDNSADCAVLRATANLGGVTHVVEATLQPTDSGITALESAFHCATSISLGFSVNFETNTFIGSNGNISASGLFTSIEGDAQASGAISGSVSGKATMGVPARQMPDETVFDYYTHMGTPIDIAMISTNLENVVLSPSSNPFGETNAAGIYVVDCQGAEIRVRNIRLLGTLVLLNPASSSRIEESVLLEPAVSNFPSLLVEGSIQIEFDSNSSLDENTASFNPPGTPFDNEQDTDTSDSFPSMIRGLVYVSGQMNFVADARDSDFEGCVICGSTQGNSDSSFTWYSLFKHHPPPGFGAGSQMEVIPGSWRRIPTQ